MEEFAKSENPNGLEWELFLARMLLEDAVNEGDRGSTIALQNVIAKLAQVNEAAKLRRGELLTKAAVVALAQQVVNVLTQSIAGRFPGWETALDVANQEILALVSDARNPNILENP